MIETVPQVDHLIDSGAPIIICVSGGKDSRLAAEQTVAYARSRNHSGQIKLCYSDLGRVVWSDAQQQCRQLAERLGVELVIVRREAGGLMERWYKRWADNVARYQNLECVKVILPWSTPTMRFCTSELKTTIIQRWIRKEFKDQPVISVLGIRRDEGRSSKTGRGAAPIFKPYEITIKDGKEKRPALPVGSVDWNPLVAIKTTTVFQIMGLSSIPLADAYVKFGATRYSCCFCIMSAVADLEAAARDPRNHEIYREQCELEITSTFSFQDGQWLSDIAPDLLTEDQRVRLIKAKQRAVDREAEEAWLKDAPHLLYVKGWPTVMPTPVEAEFLGAMRKSIGDIMEFEVKYTTGPQVMARYAELMAQRRAKVKPKTRAAGSGRSNAAKRAWETRRLAKGI